MKTSGTDQSARQDGKKALSLNNATVVAPLLAMQRICKAFPGVRALDDVSIEVGAGEVLALLGENGAGKSTLIKILGGAQQPDSGTIRIDGDPVQVDSPLAAQRAGIGVIYQEFNLVPGLTARDNIFLGQEPGRLSLIPRRREREQARSLFARLGARIDPETPCERLTVADQQIVEIAKALALKSRIIVMDEPSAALSPREVDGLFAIIEELKAQGLAVIYISHRLDEIDRIADRVTVLRDGCVVGSETTKSLSRERMIEMMVGRSLDQEFPPRVSRELRTGLEVRGLRRDGIIQDVSFDVRRGEIVGLTGLVGAGRTETARLIFGADSRDAGEIRLDGQPLRIRNPRDAIARGICLLTEDRKRQGLILQHSLLENFALPNLNHLAPWFVIDRPRLTREFEQHASSLRIRFSEAGQPAATLSGGNQQKVVLAKWLARNSEVILFDEPTRGIDVGARYEIYQLMQELAAAGKAILMISSELPEVLGMADRILVMHEGRITGELSDMAAVTQQMIMDLAVQ